MKDFLKAVMYAGIYVVPFLTMFVVNDYFFPYITGKNFAFRIVVEIAFVAWALLALVDLRYRPKFSWILTSFAGLLIVMFFANLFGQDPNASFWSNFERMDGYVTLVHVFLYVVMLGSVLTTKKQWGTFLNITLGVAFITALYGWGQYSGMIPGLEGRRIESFLGNPAYMAIYMYFHVFIAFWLLVETRSTALRVIYLALVALLVYTLIMTGTRGTALGMIVGGTTMAMYIALFGAKFPEFRKYAAGFFLLLLTVSVGFYLARDSEFIQSNGNFNRIANIDLGDDLKVRGTIWGMAWEGVKERPVLGWGQSNFNYVFNKQYDPFLYDQEQWFDRTHNIVFDWLIAGGFLGLIAYLSIFATCVYYLIWVPVRNKEDQTFTVLERGVLLGILAGYLTHNLVVFDNIISYIFFAVVLALIHSRVGEKMPQVEKVKIDNNLFNQFMVPVAGVLLVAIVYTMHVPGMLAASDIIDGYRAQTPEARLESFTLALSRNSFAHQEITEQISQQAMNMANDSSISEETRGKFTALAEREIKELVDRKPGDARVHVFFSTFYRATGNLEEAARQMDIARELSPRKQAIIMQQAIIKYSQGDLEGSRDLFRDAYELDLRNNEAREYYAATLFATGGGETAKALADNEDKFKRFALSDFLLSAVNNAGDLEYLRELYVSRIEQRPEVPQNWASLAYLHYQNKDNESAVSVLEEAKLKVPTFTKTADCFIGNLKAGREPQEGC